MTNVRPPIKYFPDFGLEKACSRSETNLSQNSDFEYSEVTVNCHQPNRMVHNLRTTGMDRTVRSIISELPVWIVLYGP